MPHASLLPVFVAFTLTAPLALAQSNVRVSVDVAGNELAAGGIWGAVSGNGRYAAFVSSDGVTPGDNNGHPDVFVRDLWTGLLRRASVTAAGVQPNDQCFQPRLSDDGRFVAFSSWADNLAASDNNGHDTDIFVKDLQTGALEHVSVSSAGVGGNDISAYHHLSGDGRFVTFYSYSSNLVANDTNGTTDTFLFDRQTGTLECLSIEPATGNPVGGGEARLSDDGRLVVFGTLGSMSGGVGGTIWLDRQTGQFSTLGTWAGGLPAPVGSIAVSGDGRKVLFDTTVPLDAADTDFVRDVYLLDIPSGALELITVPPSAALNSACYANALSDDGRFVAFSTVDALDAADGNLVADSYVLDRASGALTLAVRSDAGLATDDSAVVTGMSDDGRFVVTNSRATNLVGSDLNQTIDVFVRDRCVAGSWSWYGAGFAGSGGAAPGFALVGEPAIGSTALLALQNATGAPTLAVIGLGLAPDSVATPFGGVLLLSQPLATTVVLPQPGLLLPIAIPNLVDLCGVHAYLQAIVIDAVAPAGVAFTRGIDATIGG